MKTGTEEKIAKKSRGKMRKWVESAFIEGRNLDIRFQRYNCCGRFKRQSTDFVWTDLCRVRSYYRANTNVYRPVIDLQSCLRFYPSEVWNNVERRRTRELNYVQQDVFIRKHASHPLSMRSLPLIRWLTMDYYIRLCRLLFSPVFFSQQD